jgi:peptidoglycan/LPS O-acetylase OafA/YrhL
MDRPRIPYQPALDGLRALAVGAVIAYHFGYGWAGGGFLGVDAFFVLSGFLITTLLLAERSDSGGISLRGFWARRARRLLPALYVMLAIVCIAAIWWIPPIRLGTLRGDAIASIFYYANWHFITTGQSYFALFLNPLPLDHLWSLAIEEQFYLLWPLVVLGLVKLGRGSRRYLLAATALGIVASQVAMVLLYDEINPSRAYYGTEARAHTILVGCLLAIALRAAPEFPARAGAALQGFGVLAAIAMVVAFERGRASALYFRGGSLLFALLIAVLIAALVAPRGVVRSAFSIPPLRYIGRISYGLYLWHWPVIVYVTAERTGWVGNRLNILRLVITFAITMASFHLIEQPILRPRLRVAAVRALLPAGFAMVMIAVLVGTSGAISSEIRIGRITGGIGPCGNPPRFEIREANREAARLGPIEVPAPTPPLRIAVLGDSRACSLLTGMEAVGRRLDATVGNGTILGCGIVAGAISAKNGMMPRDFAESCLGRVERRAGRVLRATDPQMVVALSGWEVNDLATPDGDAVFGTERHDQLMLDRWERLYEQVRAPGRRLAILTTPEESPGLTVPDPDPDNSAKFSHLNDVVREFAQRHPDVVVIDLARRLCPTGFPCPGEREGVQPRPWDGIHFSPPGSTWTAHWVWSELFRHWPPPAPTAAPATAPATSG